VAARNVKCHPLQKKGEGLLVQGYMCRKPHRLSLPLFSDTSTLHSPETMNKVSSNSIRGNSFGGICLQEEVLSNYLIRLNAKL